MYLTWTNRCQLSAFFFILVLYFFKIRINNIIVFFSFIVFSIIFVRFWFYILLWFKSQQNVKPESDKDDGKDDKGKKDDNVVDADFEEVKDENKEKSA